MFTGGVWITIIEKYGVEKVVASPNTRIRAVSDDSHLEVVVRRDEPPASTPAGEPNWLEPLRRRNFDFAKLEALPGNIGYLRLNSCHPPEVAGETATSAMAFLANSDAVIIDLRAN